MPTTSVKPLLRIVEHHAWVFKHTWRSTLFTVVSPFLYLSAMGLGLGSLVDRQQSVGGGFSYVEFLAPGLLAGAAMQTGATTGAWPIMEKIRWSRVYHAMLATPLEVEDLVLGEVVWAALRLLESSLVFFGVMVLFGVVRSPVGVLAVPVAALTGLAFATPVMALSAVIRNDSGYALLFRLVVTPLFLVGGAFFPIERLPIVLQGVAWVTPLFHGVALCRDILLGTARAGSALLHVAVLLLFIGAGVVAARVTFRRQLAR